MLGNDKSNTIDAIDDLNYEKCDQNGVGKTQRL